MRGSLISSTATLHQNIEPEKALKIFKQEEAVSRLFIDPASISSGWALFIGKTLFVSGTVKVSVKSQFDRLAAVGMEYQKIGSKFRPQEVHIEQFGGRPHHILHWAVGLIGTTLKTATNKVGQDVPVSAWQKEMDWKNSREPLTAYLDKVDSEDELAAIGMGLYWVRRKL